MHTKSVNQNFIALESDVAV